MALNHTAVKCTNVFVPKWSLEIIRVTMKTLVWPKTCSCNPKIIKNSRKCHYQIPRCSLWYQTQATNFYQSIKSNLLKLHVKTKNFPLLHSFWDLFSLNVAELWFQQYKCWMKKFAKHDARPSLSRVVFCTVRPMINFLLIPSKRGCNNTMWTSMWLIYFCSSAFWDPALATKK